MTTSPPDLSQYTVQEIQLALIYKNRFNAFDGEIVAKFLIEYQDLWLAVIMDHTYAHPHQAAKFLLLPQLFKLHDLSETWHVDELFVLCKEDASRDKLIALGAERHLWEEIYRYSDREMEVMFFGHLPNKQYKLFSVWWD
jgi:hypothetical protein